MDWKTARLIRNKAFDDIYKDPDLWREWNLARTQQDRDLMINYVIFTTSFDEGYNRGTLDNFNPDEPSENY